jgi:hypothetical protein
MKPKNLFISRFIKLSKKYCKEDIWDIYHINKSSGMFFGATNKESLSMSLISFESKLLADATLSENEILFMDDVIKEVEEIFDMHSFEYEGNVFSFDDFPKKAIFLLIIKIFIDELSDENIQDYINAEFKYL